MCASCPSVDPCRLAATGAGPMQQPSSLPLRSPRCPPGHACNFRRLDSLHPAAAAAADTRYLPPSPCRIRSSSISPGVCERIIDNLERCHAMVCPSYEGLSEPRLSSLPPPHVPHYRASSHRQLPHASKRRKTLPLPWTTSCVTTSGSSLLYPLWSPPRWRPGRP